MAKELARFTKKVARIFVLHCNTLYIYDMERENKTVNINLRVSEGTKQALMKLAEQDHRTLSDYIRLQLERLAEHSKKK
jgi:hypothetical protein